MYNTTLLHPHHFSFASLIFPLLFYPVAVQWFFLCRRLDIVKDFYSRAFRRLGEALFDALVSDRFFAHLYLVSLSWNYKFIPSISYTIYFSKLYVIHHEHVRARVPLVKNSYLFYKRNSSNGLSRAKTHSAILLEESTIPATKSWCTSFTFQQLLGSGRLIWMC